MTSAAQKAAQRVAAEKAAKKQEDERKAVAAAAKAEKAERPKSRERVQLAAITPDGEAGSHELAADTEMVDVVVPKAYRLTLDNGVMVQYASGTKQMPKEHAEHWWSAAMGVTLD